MNRPIAIVDICCGYGLHSHYLHEHLAIRGVQIEKIVGVDISKQLVDEGRKKYKDDFKLSFKVANIEASFNDVA